ncbi:flagellar motor switch phosphatase FliY, partial [Sporanaerobacter acetigenes]
MTNDMLSQDEIDALLRGNAENTEENHEYESEIGDLEKDALGEIGNISMGTAATTLSTLLNQKVIITTPNVEETTIDKLADEYPVPFVAIDVSYKAGLEGANILILKVDDVKIITDILMGKEEIDLDRELTELDLSAVSEVMNQMMGSACTSLSEIFTTKIDIQPPKSYEITFSEGRDKLEIFKNKNTLVKIS